MLLVSGDIQSCNLFLLHSWSPLDGRVVQSFHFECKWVLEWICNVAKNVVLKHRVTQPRLLRNWWPFSVRIDRETTLTWITPCDSHGLPRLARWYCLVGNWISWLGTTQMDPCIRAQSCGFQHRMIVSCLSAYLNTPGPCRMDMSLRALMQCATSVVVSSFQQKDLSRNMSRSLPNPAGVCQHVG